MSCKHSWKYVDSVYKDGTVLKQCRHCGITRQGVHWGVIATAVIAIALLVAYYLGYLDPVLEHLWK